MSSLPEDIKKEIEAVAVEAVEEFVEKEGIEPDQGLELLADGIDALLPLGALIGGPLGASLERGDGPAIEAFLRVLVPLLKPNPDKILARAERAEEKGKDKRAARLRKRAKRVRKRQEKDDG
tara:strand:+ start:14862 stop:15227 length:366 start_codon:yes stop_codon:yes gene_type:complete